MLYEIYVALAIITFVMNAYTLVFFIFKDRNSTRMSMLAIATLFFSIFAAASSTGVQKVLEDGTVTTIQQNTLMYVFAAFAIINLVILVWAALRKVFESIDEAF